MSKLSYKVKDPKAGNRNINLVGEKFGTLTVISYSGLDKWQAKLWNCSCECGNKDFKVITTALRQGKIISCGCKLNGKGSARYNYSGYKDITGTKWNSIRNNAKSRKLKFEITKEEVHELWLSQDKKCNLSGLSISFKNSTASVDRINSNKGYIISNIQIVHKHVNMMKSNHSNSYFLGLCDMISKNNRNSYE